MNQDEKIQRAFLAMTKGHPDINLRALWQRYQHVQQFRNEAAIQRAKLAFLTRYEWLCRTRQATMEAPARKARRAAC